jgi:two-component system, NarL family, response regulator NreC
MKSLLGKPLIRILVVDDHSVVRDGLTVLIERVDGMTIIGSVATGEEAVLTARRLLPHVIIMDLVLPILNGIDATRHIIRDLPLTRIVVLSACHAAQHVYRALQAGASGYVLKADAGTELITAIEAVVAGGQYISPAIAASFTDGALPTSIPESPFDRLSTRERAVLQHIVSGETSADIAQHLSLSRKTVDTYRCRMMVKLKVRNRSELIRRAMEYELPPA